MANQAQRKRVEIALDASIKGVQALRKSIGKEFHQAIGCITKRKGKIVTTGVGKSGFIAMKVAATLTSLGHNAQYLNPLDALHGDVGIVDDGDVLIAYSYSGESIELVKLLRHLDAEFSIKIVGVTGRLRSTLATLSDHVITIEVNDEGSPHGLAPMASTTASLVVGDLIAAALTSPTTFKKDHFARYHPAGSLGLSLKKVKDVMLAGDTMPLAHDTVPFHEALHEMDRKRQGVVGIVNRSGKLIGIVTDGDVRRILIQHDNPKFLITKTLMTADPQCIQENTTLAEALVAMENRKITNLFVVDRFQKPIGMVHMHSIVEDSIT